MWRYYGLVRVRNMRHQLGREAPLMMTLVAAPPPAAWVQHSRTMEAPDTMAWAAERIFFFRLRLLPFQLASSLAVGEEKKEEKEEGQFQKHLFTVEKCPSHRRRRRVKRTNRATIGVAWPPSCT